MAVARIIRCNLASGKMLKVDFKHHQLATLALTPLHRELVATRTDVVGFS
jgi:hypothetical protein